jgi:hypothetical protein
LVFSLPSGDAKAESRLVIRPGSVELTPAGRPRRSWRLTGAPLLPRAVQIISPHAGRPVLMMDGLDDPIPLPSSALPTAIEFSKAAAPRDFSVGSGPPPRPREGMGAPL